MKTVYVLHHEYEWCGRDEVKLIGVYATEAEAELAVQRIRSQPGFLNWPDGFVIDPYELGKDHWAEGFATMVGVLVPSKCKDGAFYGASCVWNPGDQYEICSLDDPNDSIFAVGDFVHCDEETVNGVEGCLVARRRIPPSE